MGNMEEDITRIESEGSEPDRAAFRAAARLSTSSAELPWEFIQRQEGGQKMNFKFESSVKIKLTNQNKYQIVFFLNHFLNFLEKLSNLK